MKRIPVTPESIEEAAAVIRAGGVVAYPTETVYGLAVDPFSSAALEALFAVKGREPGKPVLLIISEVAQLSGVVGKISPCAQRCMEAFWPGPLSLLFPALPGLAEEITGGGDWVCVRCPGCATSRALCEAAGMPLTSTSANASGQPPVSSLDDLDLPGIALALDGGQLEASLPSTILNPYTRTVLRPGAIPTYAILPYLD